jgi:hypothetical protein
MMIRGNKNKIVATTYTFIFSDICALRTWLRVYREKAGNVPALFCFVLLLVRDTVPVAHSASLFLGEKVQ